ncbi:hypothetical protein, partial [Emticicia sp. W12TSBA100-4]|uniref:hypothetical protein n=1 Tax=Emticicia sp. W12TSBA100-4 TaxID=3160965 RepID=UPI003305BC3B
SVSIPYTTCDNGTPQACAMATLYINVTPICTKPVLTIQNIVCNSTGYTVTFSSNVSSVSTTNGTISGNTLTVTNGNTTLTATSSCGAVTQMLVTAPICPVPNICTQVSNLSVGQAVCNGDGTYSVSFTAQNGSVISNIGEVSGNSVIKIPAGTNAIL